MRGEGMKMIIFFPIIRCQSLKGFITFDRQGSSLKSDKKWFKRRKKRKKSELKLIFFFLPETEIDGCDLIHSLFLEVPVLIKYVRATFYSLFFSSLKQ